MFKRKNKKEVKEKKDTKLELEPVPIYKLWRFATIKDISIMILAFIFSVLNGASQPIIALFYSGIVGIFTTYNVKVIENPIGASKELQEAANALCLQFALIGFATLLCAYFQMSLWMMVGERLAIHIRHHYYRSILSQEIGWFDTISSGDVSSRISGDVHLVQDGISEKLGFMIQYFSTFITGFIVAFTQGWKLSLVMMSVVPLVSIVTVIFTKLIAFISTGGQTAYGKAASIAEEVFSAIKTIHSFGSQDREVARYQEKLLEARKDGYKRALFSGISMGAMDSIVFLTFSLGMWYGGILIDEGNYKPENVISVFFSIIFGASAIGHASPSLTALATAQGAAAKLYQVIERQSLIDPFKCTKSMDIKQIKIGKFEGNITFDSVKFSYPTRPDITTLNDISFNVDSGTTVALVGPSGSGKSTIVSLLERFYDVNSGSIKIDEVDIRDVSIEFLRSHIGIVGQEPILFATTIKQNILYGLENSEQISDIADEILQQRVEEVCKLANIHDFIISLPKGYETQVGEKGSLLSGGQKQRIAIARALIKDPKILLLDEATSALDSESEKLVQTALDKAAKNRTTIFIAHRLSTIKNADKIIVFENGKITEQGNHEMLIKEDGIYSQLVENQKLRVEEETNNSEAASDLDGGPLNPNDTSINNKDEFILDIIDEDGNPQIYSDDKGKIRKVNSSGSNIKELLRQNQKKSKKKSLPIGKIFKIIYPWRYMTLIGILGSCAIGSIMPLYSIIISHISEAFIMIKIEAFHDQGVSNSKFYALMFVALAFLTYVAILFKVGALSFVGEFLTYELRLRSFKSLIHQEISFFDKPINGVGILSSKLSTEAQDAQNLISKVLGPLFSAIASLCVGLSIAFIYGWKLTLAILICIPVTAISFYFELKTLIFLNVDTKKSYEQVSQIASESIVNIRTVAGLTKENHFFNSYKALVSKAHRSAIKSILKASLGYAFSMGAPFLIYALAFWYGTTLVVSGEYNFKQMFQVVTAVVFTGAALGSSSSQLTTYVKAKIAAIDAFDLLDSKPSIDCSDEYGTRPAKLLGNIELNNAKFFYPTRPDAPILQGLDLSILAGKRVALVGSSGSGKSTVIALTQRFYDLNSGSLNVEGVDIKLWNLPYLRSGMALVGQEPVLFDLTIKENIAYGKPDATQDEIIEAAKMANAHNFIMEQPEGYDTRVGERGSKLSGGQKQRIAIARAVLLNPKLLLLDEATSALDSESEKVVQEALDKASQDRTTITIAHRLSTIQDCDCIIVMKHGKMVEMGTHEKLLEIRGFYYSLVNQQQLTNIKQ